MTADAGRKRGGNGDSGGGEAAQGARQTGNDNLGRTAKHSQGDELTGTTRRVYRYIYRRGPVRLHDIQRELGLASPSVAEYHIRKLLGLGLIREENDRGYSAERTIFEAMVRIRRTVIPVWTTATAFFAAALIVLLTILRPSVITATYIFSVIVALVAVSISAYQTVKSFSVEAI